MTTIPNYVIRGGIEERERLRVLSRALEAGTKALLDRLGLRDGLVCADVGCGAGDVSLELARRIAPAGKVVGFDIDETKLDLARAEAKELAVGNVEYRVADVRQAFDVPHFDVVYSRFLLTHLQDPSALLTAFRRSLRPGGVVAVEDIDFSGYFTYPESPAFLRYRELYCAIVHRRGADPNIGPRLPALLKQAGFEVVDISVSQPVALVGAPKLASAMTMEHIAGAVLEDSLATADEVAEIVKAVYAFAEDPTTLASMPRIVQVWGRAG